MSFSDFGKRKRSNLCKGESVTCWWINSERGDRFCIFWQRTSNFSQSNRIARLQEWWIYTNTYGAVGIWLTFIIIGHLLLGCGACGLCGSFYFVHSFWVQAYLDRCQLARTPFFNMFHRIFGGRKTKICKYSKTLFIKPLSLEKWKELLTQVICRGLDRFAGPWSPCSEMLYFALVANWWSWKWIWISKSQCILVHYSSILPGY